MTTTHSDKVVIFTLVSGVMVIGRSVQETDGFIVLDFPFEMSLSYNTAGDARLYVTRYLPYSETQQAVVFTRAIESLCVANPLYTTFYHSKVKQFKALATGDLDEPLEGPTAQPTESSEPDVQENELEVPRVSKGNTTIH